MSSPTAENENKSLIIECEWMIRPCEMYKEEYNDCTSIKARFHQYFIYGETMDCSQWKRDYNNCVKLKETNSEKAGNELIESEKVRRGERLRAHYANNIWERRSEPPQDWNSPLPEWISKNYEHSYLGIKSKEMRGETSPNSPVSNRTMCVLM